MRTDLELLKAVLDYQFVDDCGPEGDGWRSDELQALIDEIEARTSEPAPDARPVVAPVIGETWTTEHHGVTQTYTIIAVHDQEAPASTLVTVEVIAHR